MRVVCDQTSGPLPEGVNLPTRRQLGLPASFVAMGSTVEGKRRNLVWGLSDSLNLSAFCSKQNWNLRIPFQARPLFPLSFSFYGLRNFPWPQTFLVVDQLTSHRPFPGVLILSCPQGMTFPCCCDLSVHCRLTRHQ